MIGDTRLKVRVNKRAVVVELKAVGGRGGERFGGRWKKEGKNNNNNNSDRYKV
jgi:hypothetical protein